MDFSKLITRSQYEATAKALGHKRVELMPYGELERIAAEFAAEQHARYKRAKNSVPHSFVLAEVFDCVAHELDVPEHVLEDEPGVEWVACPACDGTGSVLALSGAYYSRRLDAYYPDERLMPCPRCHGDKEVLDYVQPEASDSPALVTLRKAA